MKLFHLSDLHIGKNLDGISMLDEQRHVFSQIIAYIKTHSPDAIVIAGDIYDKPIPGVDAVRVFDDFLTALSELGVATMIIAGNHDSPERINFASRLLLDKGLFLCGGYNGNIPKITLSDEYGDVHFWLLPFIKPSSLRGIHNEPVETHEEAVAAALAHSDIDYDARNILISHQFYTKAGVSPVRSDSELDPVGGLDAVSAGIVDNFDYVALGHLHGAQSVGDAHIRYCGSPIKYSFSEWQHHKSITMAELKEKGDLTITPLPLMPIHDMRAIKGDLEQVLTVEGDSDNYLWVTLTNEEEIMDPMEKLRSRYPNILRMDYENTRTSIDINTITSNIEAIESLSTYDLFEEFFLKVQGSAMSREQGEIVRQLLEVEP
ncbi:MAG: exonuclease SbcCD subunit D [Defluviitaleaceae bacterium]|nr:exonuclease SbcCD subunit D [Defluviitaleaceae bacterium]